jgi:hypothetical protein
VQRVHLLGALQQGFALLDQSLVRCNASS